MEILPLELRKLGLSEKEAKVYLTALELGYTSVQKIAQHAKISRPTTYEIIKSLKEKGLITKSKDKQKNYFIAESPDNLLGILRKQKKEIEEKEREFIRIIAALRSKFSLDNQKEIKTYQDEKGLEILLDDLLTTSSKKIYVLVNNEKIWPTKKRQIIYQAIKKRLGQIEIKELSVDKNKSSLDYLETKTLKLSPFKETVIIYDKVIILSDKSSGILIDNKDLINLIKSFFQYIWKI
ncbi:MAG: MarR family transcriptional regulator [Candidatus Portnoybacteria bacterium]|nr:MarR family transcriptional regulator [Candidatus Portnoybacteria bacterium]